MSNAYDYQEDLLAPTEELVWDHVPRLKELLPKFGGIPGVTYAQVCTHNAKAAQDAGWGAVVGCKYYSIRGPKGSVAMVLACQGTPMRGTSTEEGARKMVLDEDIYHTTGMWLGTPPPELVESDKQVVAPDDGSASIVPPERKTTANTKAKDELIPSP